MLQANSPLATERGVTMQPSYPRIDSRFTSALFASLLLAGTLLAGTLLTGCGSGINPQIAAAIAAPAGSVRVNQTLQIQPATPLTASTLSYSVNGVPGGNDAVGHISSTGLYTAPAVVPSPSNTITITSVSSLAPTIPHSLNIDIWNPIPLVTAITPASFPEGTATITVTGSQFIYGAQIYWNGVPVPTTFLSSTSLAASVSGPNPGTYTLTVGNPDPGASLSTQVAERVVPGQVVLALQTYGGTSVRVGNRLSFGMTINGTNNTGINWLVNGVPGGNAQTGTIVANANGGATYTAPLIVPTPSNIVTLTAVSVDDPTVTLNQNVAVMNPIPVLLAAAPSTFNPGQSTVVLTGNSFISGAQVLLNGAPMPTVFDNGGQLTATLTLPDAGTIDLQVLNPAPGPATSGDLIAQVNGNPPVPLVTPEDAARFLTQSTFGATDADIRHLGKIGYPAWFNEQFNAPPTLHVPAVEQSILLSNPPCATGDTKCYAKLLMQDSNQQTYLYQSFWQQALTGNDQLRQRVKYALTQQLVISGADATVGNMSRGMANYYDVLGADAFTNFRQIMQDVTLNPMMGLFLSSLANDKGDANRDPDENFAREVMQLFTIGLYQLNPDGTQKLDPTGQPIPTYSNNDVMGLAKIFTGFSWNVPGDLSDSAWYNCCKYIGPGFGEDLLPMQSYLNHHSILQKDFLGVSIPASAQPDPNGDLKFALDTIFNHPNLPPFVSKQLIQHLVTSNPSPAYVGRVSAVFSDNGFGVRGDMKAVLQAILMDDEARNTVAANSNVQSGKVRESLLRYTEWARAFTAQSRSGVFNLGTVEDRIFALGEMSLRSPTVFNWFAPGYVPPGTSIEKAGLVAPEMQMTDVSTVVGYLNYMQSAVASTASGGPDTYSNYTTELALATTPDILLDRINLLLMAGTMDANLRSQILSAVNAIAIPTADQNAINAALLNRVRTAVYLTLASPSFSAQI